MSDPRPRPGRPGAERGRAPIMPGAQPFSHDGDDVGVLVCHGFTSTPQTMRPVARALAEAGHTVRLPLLPGHGTTWQDLNATPWTQWYAQIGLALEELRARCRVVVAVGLSMGGALAALAAEDHPDLVRGLVLVNPAFRVDDRRMIALPLLHRVLPSLPGIADDRARRDGEPELAYSRTPLRALYSQTKLWAHVVERLGSVRVPTLLMTSAEDHVVPASSADLFCSRVGGPLHRVELPNSYHVATLDHDAATVQEQTVAFVGRIAAAHPGRGEGS